MAEARAGWEQSLLAEAVATVDYPATPDLRGAVVAAVRRDEHARRVTPWARNRRLIGAVAAAVIALIALLAVPASRDAVAEFFGLVEGQKFEALPLPEEPPSAPSAEGRPLVLPTPFRVATSTPTAEATSVAVPASTPPPPPPIFELVRPSTLLAAAEALGYAPALPIGAGEPLEVFLIDFSGQGAVVLRYESFDLWQTDGPGSFGKGSPADTVIEVTQVADTQGYWIEGERRILRFLDERGDEVPGSRREVNRNTLVWRTAASFYRLEGDLTREQAIEIAESLP
jgi:hypothetical protein